MLPRRLTSRGVAAAALAVAAAAAVAGAVAALAGPGTATTKVAVAACGAAAQATVAAVDATAADRIYGNELAGTEVSFDVAQIVGAADLLAGVSADNRVATVAAVKRIVYHPAWHIVRLRALDASGRILADVGGPYVIAPVAGVLRSHGRAVGSFVMSVQDDVGYTKLETRFVGNPVAVYVASKLVAERYAAFPAAAPRGPAVKLGGVSYLALNETYKAFPADTLTVVILVAMPGSSQQREPCAAVRAGEFGRIAEIFAKLAVSLPQHYPGFAETVQIYTGADVFVREGSRQLAAVGGPGPATLPTSGTVSYQGRSWLVFSFSPRPPARVYVLAPPG
jgi:hypothetical protein